MEFHKKSNLQSSQHCVTVFLKRTEMKTLQQLAFQVLIHHLRNLSSELQMANLSYLNSKLKSLSFAEHKSLYSLPLLEELALFAFDTLDYKLTQKILSETVKFFHSLKKVTADENFKSKFLNAVKAKLLLVLPESAIDHDDKYLREELMLYNERLSDSNEIVKFLQDVLQVLSTMNAQSSECDMPMPCLEPYKITFQFLGVRRLCAYISTYTDDIIRYNKMFNPTKFSAIEKMHEGLPHKLCNIISAFLDAELHKTRNEYIYYAVKQALNKEMPPDLYTEITHLINEVASGDIPFATKKKLICILDPETCTNLSFSDLELASVIEIKDFTKLTMLSICDNYFDDVDDIQSLKCLKYLKITAMCSFSDKLAYLRVPSQLETIILNGLVENKNILSNLFSWTPHLKHLDVSMKIPGGYVYVGAQLKELEELKIKHIDLFPKYRVLFQNLPDRMKKLTCNCIQSCWLNHLSSQTSRSLSEFCFEEFTCDKPISSQYSGLHNITLSQSTLKCQDLFINVGRQLTSLTLNNCLYVNLDSIAAHCPNILNLTLVWCDFKDYDHLHPPQFPQLKTVLMAPVCERQFCGWCVIAHSAELEEIVALIPSGNSICFESFIDRHPLTHLRKFEIRMNHQSWLTAEQAQKIVEKCKHFQAVRSTEPKKDHQPYYGLLKKIKNGFYCK